MTAVARELGPQEVNAISLIQVVDIHDHMTTQLELGSILHSMDYQKKIREKCITHRIVHTINDAPELIRSKINTHSFHGFSNYTKTFCISKYSNQCTIPNCCVGNNYVSLCCL